MSSKDWKYEGERAFKRGVDLQDCPYDPGTEAFNQWYDGWMKMSDEYDSWHQEDR
jgi:hypothetical protein